MERKTDAKAVAERPKEPKENPKNPTASSKNRADGNDPNWEEMENLGDEFKNLSNKEAALLFLRRLRKKLQDGSLNFNGPMSYLHLMPEGVFLVSPIVFKRIAGEDYYKKAQSGLAKLRVLYHQSNTVFIKVSLTRKTGRNKNYDDITLSGFVIKKDCAEDYLGKIDWKSIGYHPNISIIRDGQQ